MVQRVISRGAVLAVVATFLFAAHYLTSPPVVRAQCSCVYADQDYSCGSCYKDMLCSCTGDGQDCRWINHCPPTPVAMAK